MHLPVVLTLCGLLLAGAARAGESVKLTVEDAGDELFLALGDGGETLKPEPGKCACVFRFDRFSVENINRITVVDSDGQQLPLAIEKSSIFVEFDKVVALRFYVILPKDKAIAGQSTLELKWGPGIKAENAQVKRFTLSPESRTSYRSLREDRNAGVGDPTGSTATIMVIADSSADYHFLWYLVPIGAIFALLTARKLFTKAAAVAQGERGVDPVSRDPR